MDLFAGLIIVIIFIILLDKIIAWYNQGFQRKKTQLEVLKVVSKHECFGRFKDDRVQFKQWIAKFLALKGYRIVDVPVKDNDKDIVARNTMGQTVYIACKLWDPEKWDTPVEKTEAQKLVGTMVGDGIHYGLIITTATLSESAKEYLTEVNKSGYQVKYIDGDALVAQLYDLREAKLSEILENIGIRLHK